MVALAAGLAAGRVGTSFRSGVELGRARDAAVHLSQLRPLLASLPPPAPRCAAACLPDDAAAPLGAAEQAARLTDALAALPGGPVQEERAGRLAGLVRTAFASPVSAGDDEDGPRRSAEALLAAMGDDALAQLEGAGDSLHASLPWTLGVGGAGLALGLLSLAVAARQARLRRRAEAGSAALARAAEQVRDLVTIADETGRIEFVNKAVEDVTGYSRRELVGTHNRSWLPWYQGVPFLPEMQRMVLSGKPYRAGVLGRRKTGEAFLAEETVVPLAGPKGALGGILSTARDVTEQRLLEYTLEHRGRHDLLTGLPNRRHFLRLLDQALGPDAPPTRSAAVLAIDVDRFTHVNDLLGSTTGDQLLVEVAHQLRDLAREGDLLARLGSDEFALVRIDDARPVDAATVADKIGRDLLRIHAGERDLAVTASIGIAMFPDHGHDGATLLQNADLALGKARLQGRGAVVGFEPSIASGAAETFFLEKRLAGALQNHQYLLHYQPYFELASRRPAGAEALIKWQSGELGIVSASRFVPLLEETGLILEVGRWALETACRQAHEWSSSRRDFPVSVNLSAAQFRHRQLVDTVAQAVANHRLDPALLTLEVTESVCLDDLDAAVSTLKRLKDLGVSISVDDFGTGYSSLGYLRRLPVDTIKIDMSFVRDVTRDQDAASIVSAITTLARSMELETIAEGVETEEQRNVLHLLRCDMGQGFYFSPAVPACDLHGVLDDGRPPALG